MCETLLWLPHHSQRIRNRAVMIFYLGTSAIAGLYVGSGEDAHFAGTVKPEPFLQIVTTLRGTAAGDICDGDFFASRDVSDGVYGLVLYLLVPGLLAIWTAGIIDEAERRIDCAGGRAFATSEGICQDDAGEGGQYSSKAVV